MGRFRQSLRSGALAVLTATAAAVLAAGCRMEDGLNRDTCPSSEKFCDGGCVGLLDPAYGCGSETCDPCVVGGGTAVCDTLFRCRVDQCDPGFKECDSRCVPTDAPETGCANATCDACPGGADAICGGDGSCGCPAGTKLCSDQCVPFDSPDHGCGGDACDPCSTANGATFECTAAGTCQLTGCQAGFKVCPDETCADVLDPETGCGDAATCAACALDHVDTVGCSAQGQCSALACVTGWGDCDGNAANGCESNLLTDVDNCGLCGTACAQTRSGCGPVPCVNGACRILECMPGFTDCDCAFDNGCECQGTCAGPAPSTCVAG